MSEFRRGVDMVNLQILSGATLHTLSPEKRDPLHSSGCVPFALVLQLLSGVLVGHQV